MNVGYIRLDKKPNKMVKMLAKNCGNYDIQLVYFRPEDINYENQTINGRVLENDKWIEKEVGIPPYIDICTPIFRKKKTVQFLKKYSTLSMEKRVGSNEKINNMIVRDGTFKHLIIPYIMSGYFKDFIKFLK